VRDYLRWEEKLALILFWTGVAFSVLTYDHYRGSVVTPFHDGPVSPSTHRWGLSDGTINSDGRVTFHVWSLPLSLQS